MSRFVTIWRTRAGSARAKRSAGAISTSSRWSRASKRGRISVGDLAHGLGDRDRPALDLELAGLDAGDVEQVVDEVDEPLGGRR